MKLVIVQEEQNLYEWNKILYNRINNIEIQKQHNGIVEILCKQFN